MTIIKKIIAWIKKLFSRIFGKSSPTKKVKRNVRNTENKRYLKGYGAFVEDSFNQIIPIYLLINDESKKEITEKAKMLEKSLNSSEIHKIEKIISKIEKQDISIYQAEKINIHLDDLLNRNLHLTKDLVKINEITDEMNKILDNFDYNLQKKVLEEYHEINYLTSTTLIIDETIEEFHQIEEDFKHHRYNKYYYNREILRIKNRINHLRKWHDSEEIQEEIKELRLKMFYKSKDKYDLLYNEEVFINLMAQCDELLQNVNRKVIDIKKDNKKKVVEKKDKKDIVKNNKEKNERNEPEEKMEYDQAFLENILKRFQDMELARQLIILDLLNEKKLDNENVFSFIDNVYLAFINGEKDIYHFERNKAKTELVKLYNNLNKVLTTITKEECVSIDHINYQMDDLINASIEKKQQVDELLLKKYNYQPVQHEIGNLVDNKLNLLLEKENSLKTEKEKRLVKSFEK